MTDLETTMADYLAADSPSTVCPRCGRWEGRQMPLCTEPGWTHETACARIVYAGDVCAECDRVMRGEVGG